MFHWIMILVFATSEGGMTSMKIQYKTQELCQQQGDVIIHAQEKAKTPLYVQYFCATESQ